MKRTVLFSIALLAAVSFSCFSIARAGVYTTGIVTPAQPWISSTTGYVGKTGNGTLLVDGKSVLNSRYCYVGYNSGVTGAATVTDADSNWSNGSTFYLGWYGRGILNIENAATASCSTAYIGYYNTSNSEATVAGEGSKWTNSSSLYVGRAGEGTLMVEDGGEVQNGECYLGYLANSSGTVSVDGATSKWINNANLYVGNSGQGTLNITNHSLVTVAAATYLAYGSGSSGTINFGPHGGSLTSTTLFASPDQLTGVGILNVRGLVSDLDLTFDAGHEAEHSFAIADGAGKNIAVNIDASDVNNIGDLGAGWRGAGSLNVKEEIEVYSNYGYLGYQAGSNGNAAVEGALSKWTCNSDLYVGRSGTGTLTVGNGAEMVLNNSYTGIGNGIYSYIGYSSDSTGTMTIDDAAVTGKVGLIIGNAGTGALNIVNGGTLDTDNVGIYSGRLSSIGCGVDSVGVATIDGSGSSWTEHASLRVGESGTGTLNIINGGAVLCNANAYIGYNADGVGTVNVDGNNSTWNCASRIYVGYYGKGTLNVVNGASALVNNNNPIILGYQGYNMDSIGSVLVNGEGSTLACFWTIIGENSSLNITDRGTFTCDTACTDNSYCEIYGEATVDGDGSSWTGSHFIIHSSGILNIINGGEVTATGIMNIELDSTAKINFQNGTLNCQTLYFTSDRLLGTGTINTRALVGDLDLVFDKDHGLKQTLRFTGEPDQDITVVLDMTDPNNVGNIASGYVKNGSLKIKDGVTFTSQDSVIGWNSGATGSASVEGEGSYWKVNNIFVGSSGNGSLNITEGGDVYHFYGSNAHIGTQHGSIGKASVDGEGSTWKNIRELVVGEYDGSNGSLHITNGGLVSTSKNCFIGYFDGSVGAVTVDGDGSTFECGDVLQVAPSSNGSLIVTNGGTVTNGYSPTAQSYLAYFGRHADSVATVTVDGEGSTFANKGVVYVGYSGTADLNITDGGAVTVDDATYVGYTPESDASINFNNGTLAAKSLFASPKQLTGAGTIHARGLVSDINLVFDQSHGLSQTILLSGTSGQNIAINLDLTDPNDLGDLGAGWKESGALNIKNGVGVSSVNGYLGFQAGSTGTAIISGAGSAWNAKQLYVGNFGSGTLNIVNSGKVAVAGDSNGSYSYLGYGADSSGIAAVNGDGSTWNTTGLQVGRSGNGKLTISHKAALGSDFAYLGYDATGVGNVTVTGDGSTWNNTGFSFIGYSGNGTLSILNGGSVVFPFSAIGYNSGSIGTVIVSGNGSTWDNQNPSTSILVGRFGSGTLRVNNGGLVKSGSGYIGYEISSLGAALVSGSGSKWENQDYLSIGHKGNGTLSVNQRGAVSNTYCVIGGNAGAMGAASVDGEGSTWTNSSYIYVGDDGSGTVNVTGGGKVYSASGYLGFDSGSSGIVSVDGAGSLWNINNELYVGRYGNGTLSISDGATVAYKLGYLGYGYGATGSVAVDGVDSTFSNTSSLAIGSYGSGALRISGGGAGSATSVSINTNSLLAIDVGYDSSFSVGGGAGKIANNGIVRILAGAGVPADGTPFSPIAAKTWEDSDGVYQAVGGTWDSENHLFFVSETISGEAGETLSLVLAETQRALVVDGGDGQTGWTVGASFLHKTGEHTELYFSASVIDGEALELLTDVLEDGQVVKGAWEFAVSGDGHSSADPVYLSFAIGAGANRNNLLVWYFDGAAWTPFDAMDLTVNDGWAGFTAAGFSGYALVVPEPGTLALLLAAASVCATIFLRRKRR